MLDSNKLVVVNDDGKEVEMQILFTFDNEETGKSYVLFTDPADEEGEVFAYAYDEEGNLILIEDEAEFAMIDEVFGAFMDEFENEEE